MMCRIAGRIFAASFLLLLALMQVIKSAHAIVSDRHLQGVRALECELESSPAEFRMLVDIRKHTLQLEDAAQKIAYEEISDDTLRFQLALSPASARTCELRFPAGSLICLRDDGNADIGFCLPLK